MSRSFIEEEILSDLGEDTTRLVTRFPPEPNGYLHIGHAKSICLNFGLGAKYGGKCHLRFDDTNPIKETREYVDAIEEDVRWLGFDWGEHLYHAADYFDELYGFAIKLIENGKAYVDSLTAEEIREYRGTLTEPGKNSPHRERSVEENLSLFEKMKDGEFAEGEHVLRAKIDMASPNINMRDPALYRILNVAHHRTGDKWHIYPMYDFAHPLSDAIEGVTHSICTLEFEDHRPLYNWVIQECEPASHPRQIEFARLNLTHTVMSKRKLHQLVTEGHVAGWDDPRMPTISGLRRRGYTPESIRDFCDRIGAAKSNSVTDIKLLEHCLREDLNIRADRVMVVVEPIKLVITNYPEDKTEEFQAENNPTDEAAGTHAVPFCRELYIEREDFMEDPPKKFFRLAPGREVRLKYAYFVTCDEVIRDASGEISEVRCTYDPESRGGSTPDSRKVKGTLHWVSARHAIDAEVRRYGRLFELENPGAEKDRPWEELLNPSSLEVFDSAKAEPFLKETPPGRNYQFLRMGYYCVDRDSVPDRLVFNETVSLRESK